LCHYTVNLHLDGRDGEVWVAQCEAIDGVASDRVRDADTHAGVLRHDAQRGHHCLALEFLLFDVRHS